MAQGNNIRPGKAKPKQTWLQRLWSMIAGNTVEQTVRMNQKVFTLDRYKRAGRTIPENKVGLYPSRSNNWSQEFA